MDLSWRPPAPGEYVVSPPAPVGIEKRPCPTDAISPVNLRMQEIGAAMHCDTAARLELLHDLARSHRTRLHILALVAKHKVLLGLKDLRQELPGQPVTSVVRYHPKVLASIALLPMSAEGDGDDT